jgi:hypothetical protein
LWQRYIEWIKKRQKKHFEWWAKKREKGQSQFVLSCGFIFCIAQTIGTAVFSYYFDGFINWRTLPIKIIVWFVGGIILGVVGWWSNEKKHQKTLNAKNVS